MCWSCRLIWRLSMTSCHVIRLSILCVHLRRRSVVTNRLQIEVKKSSTYVSSDLSSFSFLRQCANDKTNDVLSFSSSLSSSFVRRTYLASSMYIYQPKKIEPREQETESIQRCALFMRRNVKIERCRQRQICNEWWTNRSKHTPRFVLSMSWNQEQVFLLIFVLLIFWWCIIRLKEIKHVTAGFFLFDFRHRSRWCIKVLMIIRDNVLSSLFFLSSKFFFQK